VHVQEMVPGCMTMIVKHVMICSSLNIASYQIYPNKLVIHWQWQTHDGSVCIPYLELRKNDAYNRMIITKNGLIN
jgi:hypothetical protein